MVEITKLNKSWTCMFIPIDVFNIPIRIIIADRDQWRDEDNLKELFTELGWHNHGSRKAKAKTLFHEDYADVYIYLSRYDPGLLAHELVHTYWHMKNFLWIDDEETQAYISWHVIWNFMFNFLNRVTRDTKRFLIIPNTEDEKW